MTKRKPLDDNSDWTFKKLEQYQNEIARVAEALPFRYLHQSN